MVEKKESDLISWVIIALLVLYFFAFSLFSYNMVGDLGPPTWDLGTVKDVPAESPYAVYGRSNDPQHVMGKQGE